MNNNDNIDALLAKLLMNEASDEERLQIQQWIEADEENLKYFDDFKLIWEQSKNIQNEKEFLSVKAIDENEAWSKFQQRIQNGRVVTLKERKKYRWVQIAAILVIVFGAGMYYFYGRFLNNTVTLYSYDNVLKDTLPDGSIVTLNKNSSVSYPKKFKANTRDVALTGEAFFNVAPDKKHPFIIAVKNITVKVVGTSFNINSSQKSTEVIVETGIVQVNDKSSNISLHPNEKLVIADNAGKPIVQQSKDRLYNYYKTRVLECNETPLKDLTKKLEEIYNVHITIEDSSIADLPLTTTFDNESLDKILSILSTTFNISYSRNGSDITIKKQ